MSTSTPPAPTRTRIDGFDLARALAIIGMMTSHLGPDLPWVNAASNGFPSALFAVLAGVSLCLMHARADAEGGPALARARHRTLIRGVILVGTGMVLSTAQAIIAVVLGSIGAIYLVLGPCTRWRTRWLLAGAVALPLMGIALSFYLYQGTAVPTSPLLDGAYPILNWLAYGLFGMVLLRAFQSGARAATAVTLAGIAVGGYALWQRHLTGELGHGENPLDVVYSYGFSAGVIGLCLLLTRPRALSAALYPLRSMGIMALTVYAAHVLTAAIPLAGYPFQHSEAESGYSRSAEDPFPGVDFKEFRSRISQAQDWEDYMSTQTEMLYQPMQEKAESAPAAPETGHTGWWLGSIAGALLFCSAWRAWRPRGPLEEALRRAAYRGSGGGGAEASRPRIG
ncbi:DUF1624 domain-containing protein [Corynebacterium mastitidis]|uniref:Heparan-alpha-glucosaminide N-acetyltransferase catalytic domain-containing protein n=1 Tax=Corynebacterium mastitidis TaxID=161890 RepID=A0A2N0X8A9_9CORY|nr:heparan-alpha-glucosaminide N-acetyltransferase domain-containing protein [Corynebacterium mastitidis]MCH6196827.1 DUF1624 domain-containing protein [Corynebacterium mastitidis]PKF68951.1 hypothetical protein CXB45_04385 [Corynebacterium mastitidis]